MHISTYECFSTYRLLIFSILRTTLRATGNHHFTLGSLALLSYQPAELYTAFYGENPSNKSTLRNLRHTTLIPFTYSRRFRPNVALHLTNAPTTVTVDTGL